MEFWGALSKEVLSCILPAIGWLSCPTHFASARGGHHEGLGHVSGPQLFWTVVISMWGVRRELTFHSLMFSSHERNWYLKNKQKKKTCKGISVDFLKNENIHIRTFKNESTYVLSAVDLTYKYLHPIPLPPPPSSPSLKACAKGCVK